MISATESEWAQMMVNTLYSEGYTSYVVREVYNDDYADMELYVSREPISFDSSTRFTVIDGLCFTVDSSPRYSSSSSYTGTSVSRNSFSGSVSARSFEFLYSNSKLDGVTLVPDIRYLNGGQAHEDNQTALGANLFVLCAFLLTYIGIKLFRA